MTVSSHHAAIRGQHVGVLQSLLRVVNGGKLSADESAVAKVWLLAAERVLGDDANIETALRIHNVGVEQATIARRMAAQKVVGPV